MANVVEVIFRGVDQISRNTARMNRSMRRLQQSAARLGRTLIPAFGGALLVREMGRAADTMTLVENRIRLVTDSVAELNSVQERLFRVAQDTRSAFAPTVELYARVARSTKDLGITQQEIIDLTRTVNQTIQISGATAQEASAGVIQFAQALASGELRGEELRSVMEQLSGLSLVLARGLGVGVGELREMAEAGELTAERIIRVLREQAPQVAAEFDQITPTIAGSFQVLQNSLTRFIGNLSDATGASDLLSDSLIDVASGVDSLADAVDQAELARLERELAAVNEQIELLVELREGVQSRPVLPSGAVLGLPNESDRQTFAELVQLAEALEARIKELRDVDSGLALIDVSAIDLEPLNEALARIHEKERKRARQTAESLISAFESVEEQIERQLREVDFAAAFIPDDLEAKIRERIKAQRLEGLEPIIVGDIVDVDAMEARLDELLDATTEWERQMEAIADEAARSMQRAFSDFFFDPFQDGLDGMVAGFLNAVRRMIADEAAVRFFNLLSGKGGGGGGLLGGIIKGIGSIFGGGSTPAFPGGPPRAHGGFTIPGMFHPVNEREPEFLFTRGRSEVVPLSKLPANGAGGGSRVFSPTTNFNLMTAPLTRDQLEEFSETREDMLFAKFKRMLRDDGLD